MGILGVYGSGLINVRQMLNAFIVVERHWEVTNVGLVEFWLWLMVSVIRIDNLNAIHSVVLLNSYHAFSLTKIINLWEVNAHVHTSTLIVPCSLREGLFDTHTFKAHIISWALVQLFPGVCDAKDSWRWACLLNQFLISLYFFNWRHDFIDRVFIHNLDLREPWACPWVSELTKGDPCRGETRPLRSDLHGLGHLWLISACLVGTEAFEYGQTGSQLELRLRHDAGALRPELTSIDGGRICEHHIIRVLNTSFRCEVYRFEDLVHEGVMREFFLNKMIIIYPISFPLQMLDFLSETNLRDIHVVDRVSRIGFSPIGLKLFDLLVRIYDIRVCEEENFWFSLF